MFNNKHLDNSGIDRLPEGSGARLPTELGNLIYSPQFVSSDPAGYALYRLLGLLNERGIPADAFVPQVKNRLLPLLDKSDRTSIDTHIVVGPTKGETARETIPEIAFLVLAPQLAQLRTQRERLTVIRELLTKDSCYVDP